MEDLSIPLEALEEAHICARREHNELAPLRPEVLHCYGVDFLSNKEVLEVFEQWQPQQVEWLDDSSCNLIFDDVNNVAKAIADLAAGPSGSAGPWTRTRPLSVGSKDAKKGKARRGGLRNFCLQLRLASEADRKDPGHSGHTDSVYYAHVKEQQAEQKQATELRRMKKRQRQMTPRHKEAPQAPGSVEAAPGPAQSAPAEPAQAAPAETSSSGNAMDVSKVLHGSILSTRSLASCGLLDPLLFLKAAAHNKGSQGSGESEAVPALDLKASLKRAEAEYAAVLNPALKAPAARVPGPPSQDTAMAKASAGRGRPHHAPGRQREGTPGRPGGRDATPGRPGQRGKKRRPVDQEPRPVNEAAPPQRKVELLPEVDAFLKKHGVRYKRHVLQRSFRSIRYAQQEAEKTKAMAQKQAQKETSKTEEITKPGVEGVKNQESPWDQYMKANKSFTSQGVFMQTVAWRVEGRRVLSVVPHPQMTDIEKVAKAVQKPVASVVQCKLKDISQETGFPVFVCPPFGYPPDADGRPPLLLVDSSVADLKKPLLFDCGTTGLCLTVSEFLRSTRAACVENLAKPNPRQKVLNNPGCRAAPLADSVLGEVKSSIISPVSNGAASPEPAPEPAPITGDRSDLMEH